MYSDTIYRRRFWFSVKPCHESNERAVRVQVLEAEQAPFLLEYARAESQLEVGVLRDSAAIKMPPLLRGDTGIGVAYTIVSPCRPFYKKIFTEGRRMQ